ncbi:hypothetical protein F444_22473, partial [Phytophthora nicotianae P1976]
EAALALSSELGTGVSVLALLLLVVEAAELGVEVPVADVLVLAIVDVEVVVVVVFDDVLVAVDTSSFTWMSLSKY